MNLNIYNVDLKFSATKQQQQQQKYRKIVTTSMHSQSRESLLFSREFLVFQFFNLLSDSNTYFHLYSKLKHGTANDLYVILRSSRPSIHLHSFNWMPNVHTFRFVFMKMTQPFRKHFPTQKRKSLFRSLFYGNASSWNRLPTDNSKPQQPGKSHCNMYICVYFTI